MEQFFLQKRQSQISQRNEKDNLADFKYILSNQHSKEFHLVDSPDLVFQLAQYKFSEIKNSRQKEEIPTNSPKNRKFYRHKSQQESPHTDSFYTLNSNNLSSHNTKINNNNPLYRKFQQTSNTFGQESSYLSSEKKQTQSKMKKIDFKKDKNNDKKDSKFKENPFIWEFKNQQEKQNLHAKILSVNRPMTSTAINVKSNGSKQPQQKSWKKAFQRKKYTQLKTKLQTVIKHVQSCAQLNFSQVFQYQQAILKDYLASFVIQLKKECLQKGQLIETIWNTFFTLLSKMMTTLITTKKSSEKTQLQTQINLHEGYQEMYLYEASKIIEVGKKYNQSKNVIDRLIYQLRYKRKQAKKLYKSLAICNDKLNEYKIEHIDLQNEHIDLLIQANKMDKDDAVEILKRKMEVNKEKYMKLKVGMNKQKMKEKIEKQIEEEELKPQDEELFKKQLSEKINSLKNKKKKTNTEEKQQSHLIEEFIEKFSNKFIEIEAKEDEVEISKTIRRPQKASTGINTDQDFKGKIETTYSVTQSTFSDKLEFCLINNRSTQTPGVQKFKKTQNVEIQVDGDNLKLLMTRAKMTIHRSMDLSFLFDTQKRDQKVKHMMQGRRSQYPFKKKIKDNNSISELSSDGSQSNDRILSKKRLSKDLSNFKKQKKTSIFNSTLPSYLKNLAKPQQKQSSNSKIHKKRVSQMPQISFGESNMRRLQSQTKKRTFVSPQSHQRGVNRSSICVSNVDSFTDNFSISQQKEKYIQSYIMSKDQQYEVLEQNAIFDTFKKALMSKNQKKKSSFFYNLKGHNSNLQILQTKNEHDEFEEEDDEDFLNPKEIVSSFEQIKDSQNQISGFKRTDKKLHSMKPSSFNKIKDNTIFKSQKQNLKKAHFLNRIIEFTVKKSLLKKKVDQSNFQACKQKSQFTSITEKLDPFMLDVQFLINQNFTKKRKHNMINIKSANKFLMMTYSRSIDKIYRNNAILENLIRPLFECFEVIYGALKPNDIYRKMVAFISDLISVKDNENFKQFIFFLGLDKDNLNSAYLTTFDVCLYLKLLERLNIGGKISTEIESVFTSKIKVNSQLLNVLQSQNISPSVIQLVLSKIKDVLEKLEDFVRESMPSTEQQSKINLFKVSRMIVEEVIKIRIQAMKKLDIYLVGSSSNNIAQVNVKDIQREKNEQVNVESVIKIVECCRMSTARKLYFSKYIEELCSKEESSSGSTISGNNKRTIKKRQLSILLVRVGLVNFDELQERVKYIEERGSKSSINSHSYNTGRCQKITTSIEQSGQQQFNHQNFAQTLQKLSIIEGQANNILDDLLGDLKLVYEIGLIKHLEVKKDKMLGRAG